MKTLRLSLVVALSALGLQACDVNVKPAEHAAGAPQETATAPQPAAPVDATPTRLASLLTEIERVPVLR